MRLPYPTENLCLTLWPVLAEAGDQLQKTVPRPPGLEAAIGLVTAACTSGQTGDPA